MSRLCPLTLPSSAASPLFIAQPHPNYTLPLNDVKAYITSGESGRIGVWKRKLKNLGSGFFLSLAQYLILGNYVESLRGQV